MILIKQHSNTQLYMYPPPRRKQKIKKFSTKQQQKRLAVHPNTTASSQTQPTRRQQRASPSTSNTIRIHSNPLNQATATRLAVRIHIHRLNLTPPQPRTPKKSPRGVQRGRGFTAPLRFSFFPKTQSSSNKQISFFRLFLNIFIQ